MNKGILSIIFVYGIILSEYGIFTLIFIPAYYKTYQEWGIFIGIEFTILYLLIHYSYYLVQFTNPGSPNQDLAKQYHQQTLIDIQARTKKHVEQINKMRKRKLFKQFELAEEDDEIFFKVILYRQYNQNLIVLSARILKYLEHIIVKNVKNVFQKWIIIAIGQIIVLDYQIIDSFVNFNFMLQHVQYNAHFLYLLIIVQMNQLYQVQKINKIYYKQELNANQRFLCWICAFTSLSLVLSMGYLLGFHIYLITKNMTTVEYHIDEMKTDNPFKKPQTIDNIKEILGSDYLYWILPLKEPYKCDQRISEAYEL